MANYIRKVVLSPALGTIAALPITRIVVYSKNLENNRPGTPSAPSQAHPGPLTPRKRTHL